MGIDGGETLNDFEAKISHALMNDEAWVETTPQIIHYFNRKGMGGAKHFIYKGIKVGLPGVAAEVEAYESLSAEDRIHPKRAATGA